MKILNFLKNLNFKTLTVTTIILFVFVFTFLFTQKIYLKEEVVLNINEQESCLSIAQKLQDKELIKNKHLFLIYSLVTFSYDDLKPGEFKFIGGTNIKSILRTIKEYNGVKITIKEGYSIYQVQEELLEKQVLFPTDSIFKYKIKDFQDKFEFLKALPPYNNLEGFLFPESYYFLKNTNSYDIVYRMLLEFETKLFSQYANTENFYEDLILASILEKEIPNNYEKQLAADVLRKRIKKDMPLQVDCTLCYMKQIEANKYVDCYPIYKSEKETKSAYNTYLNKNFPKGPISNPSIESYVAALRPLANTYYYFISDPQTRKTIFSHTLEGHIQNIKTYLR
jgi:UPF0755 protein